MYIVHVSVTVKPDKVEDFIAATLDNAKSSVLEPGVLRFDVVQQVDQANKFILVEIYHSSDDAARHKETTHYLIWRDRVAEMMAVAREGIKYKNIFPFDSNWR